MVVLPVTEETRNFCIEDTLQSFLQCASVSSGMMRSQGYFTGRVYKIFEILIIISNGRFFLKVGCAG